MHARIGSGDEAWHASKRFAFEPREDRFNHNVFRYPAKFHPPVAAALVEKYSAVGDLVLDPFCGSGTLLVEAMLAGRNAIGSDVDPLAVFISKAKTQRYDFKRLDRIARTIASRLEQHRALDLLQHGELTLDVGETTFALLTGGLAEFIPTIPNIGHWFRRRAILNLAFIAGVINSECRSQQAKHFFGLCFASIIRNSSNADPVPVSGLEVTKHMKAKELAGRIVDPIGLMLTAISKTSKATKAFLSAAHPEASAEVKAGDARHIRKASWQADVVITSPPYLSAVDYYRRHQLEMYWLGMVRTQEERRALLAHYIGRHGVSMTHLRAEPKVPNTSALTRDWLDILMDAHPAQARALQHYSMSMARVMSGLPKVTAPMGRIVMVIGDSAIKNKDFPTARLIAELAPEELTLEEVLWYPLENRYMSYARHNGADIKVENVLVFRRG